MPKSRQRWVTELVELVEGAGVEQQLDALARGQLAGLVLLADALLAAAELCCRKPPLQLLDVRRRLCHGGDIPGGGQSRPPASSLRSVLVSQDLRKKPFFLIRIGAAGDAERLLWPGRRRP